MIKKEVLVVALPVVLGLVLLQTILQIPPLFGMILAPVVGLGAASLYTRYISRKRAKSTEDPALVARVQSLCSQFGYSPTDVSVVTGDGLPYLTVKGGQITVSPAMGQLLTDAELGAMLQEKVVCQDFPTVASPGRIKEDLLNRCQAFLQAGGNPEAMLSASLKTTSVLVKRRLISADHVAQFRWNHQVMAEVGGVPLERLEQLAVAAGAPVDLFLATARPAVSQNPPAIGTMLRTLLIVAALLGIPALIALMLGK